jgi:predicted ArsR family transcriptional regulator
MREQGFGPTKMSAVILGSIGHGAALIRAAVCQSFSQERLESGSRSTKRWNSQTMIPSNGVLTYSQDQPYVNWLKDSTWRKRLLDSSRGQILQMLRARDRTVNELAAQLRLTDNAVRAHLISLERDGFVVQCGTRAGSRKPHALYAVTPAVEQLFPKAYDRVLDRVLDVIRKRLTPPHLRRVMRETGSRVAGEFVQKFVGKSRQQRIKAAIAVLGELGGAATLDRVSGTVVIRGRGCPLAAATAHHSEACLIAEALLSRIVGRPVKERCQRGANPSCCFEI